MYRFSALGHVPFQCNRACTVSVRLGMYRFRNASGISWISIVSVRSSPKLTKSEMFEKHCKYQSVAILAQVLI